jgi:hypothetical protein
MSKLSMVKDMAENVVTAEAGRTQCLLQEARKLAAGTVVVIGFQLLDAKALLESSSSWAKIMCYVSLTVLSAALWMAFHGQQVKGYASYPNGNTLWDNLKPETVSEEKAEEALVHMLLKTRDQNARLNDAKIRTLSWCRKLLFVGILALIGSQLLDAYTNGLTD